MIKTKSIHSPIAPDDGLRILASRFRGRGLSKDRYDVWMANLGPSEQLLRSFLNKEITWKQYCQGYKDEIFSSPDLDGKNKTIKNHGQKFTLRLLGELSKRQNVTILCHCAEDEAHCHRHILDAIIKKLQ